jgi:peptidoglycan/LPS O-acetylase OafA/YrhL
MEKYLFNTPLLIFLVYGIAFATATTLVKFVRPIRRHAAEIGTSRNVAIDGLRGFLALAVFIHHLVITWFYNNDRVWQGPQSNLYNELGLTSVAVFFMITAFLFWGKLIDNKERINFKKLFIGRVFRLYPLYLAFVLVMVLIVFGISGWQARSDIGTTIRAIICWIFFAVPGQRDINGIEDTWILTAGVLWSLKYEWIFYIALPVFGLLFTRSKKIWPAIGAGLAIALFLWVSPFKIEETMIFLMFLGGIAAAYLSRISRIAELGRSPLAALCATVALLVVLLFFHDPYLVLPIILLSFFFIVVSSGNTLFGILELKFLRWLGEISYSTYLTHGMIVWFTYQYIYFKYPSIPHIALFAIATVALICINSFSYMVIEKPGMDLGQRILSKGWIFKKRIEISKTAIMRKTAYTQQS